MNADTTPAVPVEGLLPCPFCGHAPEVAFSDIPRETACRIRCPKCGAEKIGADHRHSQPHAQAEAIRAWNRRALTSAPAPVGGGEALPPISLDGPHKPGEQRQWLARQLLDSRLDDDEAFSVVAFHPNIKDALATPPPAPAREEGGAVKPLEWRAIGQLAGWATPATGSTYAIQEFGSWVENPFQLIIREADDTQTRVSFHLTLDEAKSAAQRDFVARVTSALTAPSSGPPVAPAREEGGAVDRSDALTPRQMDALHDAFNRVLAGEYDGEIPIEVYQRAYDKICVMGNRIAALTTPKEAPAATGAGEDLDLYDDKVQEGITWTMRQWGEALGLTTWTQGDGSESVEGDVHAEIHTILGDAGLRDPETNEMATLRGERVVEAVLEMAAKAVEDHQREGREWVPGSLWDDITRQAAGRIRAVKTQAFTILTKSGEAELLSDPQQLKRAEPVTDPYTLDGA